MTLTPDWNTFIVGPEASPARWLEWLLLSVMVLFLALIPIQAFNLELALMGLFTLLFLWTIRIALHGRITFVWSSMHWVMVAFLAVGLWQVIPLPFPLHESVLGAQAGPMSEVLTDWPYLTMDRIATTKAIIATATIAGWFFLLPMLIGSDRRLRFLVDWLIGIGFGVGLLWILNRFSPGNDPLLEANWPGGFFFRGLEYVGLLEMLIPLPLALIFVGGTKKDLRILYGFAAVLMGVALSLSGKSASLVILGLEFMIVILLAVRGRVRRHRPTVTGRALQLVGGGMIVVGLVVGVVWTAQQPIQQVISADVNRELRGTDWVEGKWVDETRYTRLNMWKSTLSVIADHPILGVGLGALPMAFPRYDPVHGLLFVNAAHNDFLQLLSEMGFVGAILLGSFLWMMSRLFKKAWRADTAFSRSVALGAGVGCLGILVHSLVDFFLQTFVNALLFFVLLALLVVVAGREQRPEVSVLV